MKPLQGQLCVQMQEMILNLPARAHANMHRSVLDNRKRNARVVPSVLTWYSCYVFRLVRLLLFSLNEIFSTTIHSFEPPLILCLPKICFYISLVRSMSLWQLLEKSIPFLVLNSPCLQIISCLYNSIRNRIALIIFVISIVGYDVMLPPASFMLPPASFMLLTVGEKHLLHCLA